jgi:predicted ribosome quality control (RQC) complex YloA/Tae2 family protein
MGLGGTESTSYPQQSGDSLAKRPYFDIFVHNPMITSFYTLDLLSRSLDTALRGKAISGAYTQEKNHLVLVFGPSDPALFIACTPRSATLFLQPRHGRAKRNATDVLASLTGRVIGSVHTHPTDRVVFLSLSGGLRIAALCYGTSPNALIVDSTDTVTDAFLNAKELTGTQYHPASGSGEEIVDLGALGPAIDAAPEIPVHIVLRRTYPRLGETLVREVLHRAGIPPEAKGAGTDEQTRMQAALAGVHRELAAPRPVIYTPGDRQTPVALSLVPLHHLDGLTATSFDDIHEAVRVFLSRRHAGGRTDTERQQMLSVLSRIITKTRRTIAAVGQDMAEADRAADYERSGKLLLTHLDAVRRGDRTVTLTELDVSYTITLDPRLSGADNAQRFFARAKSSRSAQREAIGRLDELRRRETAAVTLQQEIEHAETVDELRLLQEARKEDLAAFGIYRGPAAQAEPPPFRLFTVDGGFQVWAGKNSASNDDLTLHHSRPNDLWFHARGSGGAHVVLKVDSGRGEPGRKAKEQAAGIAAWYSKGKNAGMVPVAMTLRKYVRKPKGAPAGTVTLEREDVIFARPHLPDTEGEEAPEKRK